jgi:glutathione S-transferase
MKLYGFPPSPNTWKVRALASHLGLSVEHVFVDIRTGEQKRPEFLAISPLGRTPVLVDGDFALWESNAILQYLASKKRTPLWPDDARSRADISRWQFWQARHWGAQACEQLLFEHLVKGLFGLGQPDPAAVARAAQAFHTEARMLEEHLRQRSYLVNETLTLADFSVAALLFYTEQARYPLEPYPNIRRWFGTVSAWPCWAQSAPGRV